MSISRKLTTLTTVMLATLLAFGPVRAKDREIIDVTVLSALEAANIDLGSKRALGYYGRRNGRCDLTLMMSENELERASKDGSAARLSFVINPGRSARVESVEGKTAEFFCGLGARRMIVKVFSVKTTLPHS